MEYNISPTPEPTYSVLALCPSLSAGGSERTALNLVKHLPHFGIKLQLGLFLKRGSLFDSISDNLVITEFGDKRNKIFNSLSEELQFYANNIARIVQRTNPDVVLTILPMASLAWKAALDLKLSRSRPWIALDGHNPLRWIEDEMDTASQVVARNLIREAYLSADRIVSASWELGTAIREAYGLNEQKVVHIYNPVEVKEIRQACAPDLRSRSIPPVIITAARLVHQKGIDILLRAFKILCHQIDARLIILGTGPLRENLLALANILGVSEQVEFRGFHPEPWILFTGADICVLSSRWEGFGHTLVEAMAAGVPIIAADCDYGPREVLSGGAGILVEPENEVYIATALISLINDSLLRAGLIERGYVRASEFDTSVIIPSFANLIREVIDVSESSRGNNY